MATRKGIIKKTELSAYSNPRQGGIIALTLDDDDKLIGVEITDGHREILLGTRMGIVIRFTEQDVRAMAERRAGSEELSWKKVMRSSGWPPLPRIPSRPS